MKLQDLLNQLQCGGTFRLYDYEIEFIENRAKELGIEINIKEKELLEKRKFRCEKKSSTK
ncbi:MAG: hypothetical protein MJH09_00900 [Cetobacterium sp.]|nr:hypothetical protein [Cetobacterium sp.]